MPTNDSNEDKKAFFAKLNALDDSDDDTQLDERRLRAMALLEGANSRKQAGVVPAEVATASNLVRQTETQEDLKHSSSLKPTSKQLYEPFTSVNTHKRDISTLDKHQRSAIENLMAATFTPGEIPQATKSFPPPSRDEKSIAMKRKRTTAGKLVPEEQRIFSGLTFFFFPNNDINKTRRMRISKAVEYGAAWAKEWTNEVSHVIVDKDIEYSELLKYLDTSSLPAAVVSVNETYLSDCIAHHSMLDPTQKQYGVIRAPNSKGVAPAATGTATKDPKSLLLPDEGALANPCRVSPTSTALTTSINAENSKHTGPATIDTIRGPDSDITVTTHSMSDEVHSMVPSGKRGGTMSTTSPDPGLHRLVHCGLSQMAERGRPANFERPKGIVQPRQLVPPSPSGNYPDRDGYGDSSGYNPQHIVDTDAGAKRNESQHVELRHADKNHGDPHSPETQDANVSHERSDQAESHDAKHDRTQYDDALTAAIAEAKTLGNVVGDLSVVASETNLHQPLDLEDEDSHEEQLVNNDSSGGEETSDEEPQPRTKKQRKKWQENFQCMQKHDGSNRDTNPNARTIEVLEQMGHYYDRIDDHWRTIAYRKAVATLRKQTTKVTTKEEALQLPFIGDRLAEKIQEIVWTNKLRRLDNTLLDPSDQVLQLFMQIYGVGLSQASRWVNAGFKTLDDLRNNVKLTENQKIGLAHFDDFRARIPRQEVQQHGDIVSQALQEIDPAFEATIGGSYRRGARDSGDIDLIITKPDANLAFIRTVVLDQLVPMLFEKGFLKAALAKTHPETGTKWHGASALPSSNVWRRIDFLLVPWDQLGAALIYFTGNDIFNRSIRLLASKKGMRLNQRGLYRNVMRGKGREKITEGELVEGKSEKKIFEILGVPWRPPEHRIC